MDTDLLDKTKVASYFLWEYTHHGNALSLWHCAEDLACFIEKTNFLSTDEVRRIVQKGNNDTEYVGLVRELAYRIFVYTRIKEPEYNWFAAEKLLINLEWWSAEIGMAEIYRKNSGSIISGIRSNDVREYYQNN